MSTHADPAGGESPGRILIVDDEPLNVDYLEQELECLGFVTEVAANGLEALQRVTTSPPDLILLDVMMPELDGIATLRILKQDPETRLIPVVLMTALNAVEDRVRGIEAGADDFLSKPVDDRELVARIRTAISRKRVIDATVGQLQRTSAHLEQFGRRERDIAVVAVDWRLDDGGPRDVVGFVGRHRRDSAEQLIGELGGQLSETGPDDTVLIAVFDGTDVRSRATKAVEAGLTVVAETVRKGADGEPWHVLAAAAIAVGRALVGSKRRDVRGGGGWMWGAEGAPVEVASALARRATSGEVVVPSQVAVEMNERFSLQRIGTDTYRVVGRSTSDTSELGDVQVSERRVATVLVTDIVGSTSTMERLGDRAGAELLAAHDRVTRAELTRHAGEEINTAGDGFLAAFDSPTRAIRCACAIVASLRELGLTIRAGMHTGELERIDDAPRGIAMHLSVRIAHRAAPGEILVSSTTRELAAGAGLVFLNRGQHHLKGLAEARELFAVIPEQSRSSPEVVAAARETSVTTFPAGLTAREVDVLRLVAVGLSDAAVAEQLYLSVRTVNAHLRSIYRKAGLRSRAGASRFAEENHLL